MSQDITEPASIALDAPLYMAITQEFDFTRNADGTVTASHYLLTDGPYTTPARAEAALNSRADRNRFMEVIGAPEPYSVGMFPEHHGGIRSWKRDTTCLNMHTGTKQEAWQAIEMVFLDEGEHTNR